MAVAETFEAAASNLRGRAGELREGKTTDGERGASFDARTALIGDYELAAGLFAIAAGIQRIGDGLIDDKRRPSGRDR